MVARCSSFPLKGLGDYRYASVSVYFRSCSAADLFILLILWYSRLLRACCTPCSRLRQQFSAPSTAGKGSAIPDSGCGVTVPASSEEARFFDIAHRLRSLLAAGTYVAAGGALESREGIRTGQLLAQFGELTDSDAPTFRLVRSALWLLMLLIFDRIASLMSRRLWIIKHVANIFIIRTQFLPPFPSFIVL